MTFFVHQKEDKSVVVGGIRLLCEFTPEEVEVKIRGGNVRITGEHLKIERFDVNEIEIKGKIQSVCTDRAGRGSK
ncbi:MAG: YabP/YqfC family sporulation protein [Firmicutes bacterium]|nr:YabP/YqfC family sporulation protein [Bacillota bacterium]